MLDLYEAQLANDAQTPATGGVADVRARHDQLMRMATESAA